MVFHTNEDQMLTFPEFLELIIRAQKLSCPVHSIEKHSSENEDWSSGIKSNIGMNCKSLNSLQKGSAVNSRILRKLQKGFAVNSIIGFAFATSFSSTHITLPVDSLKAIQCRN